MARRSESYANIPRSFWFLSGALGVAWWVLLLLLPMSRDYLVTGSVAGVGWGFARVLAIVMLFSRYFWVASRVVPWSRWPNAMLCLWFGCALFAMTAEPKEELGLAFILAPMMFIGNYWYVLLPGTVLTAVVIARVYRAHTPLRVWYP